MSDSSAAAIRERVWLEKVDKTVDPPRVVETVMIENGEVKEVTRHGEETEADAPAGAADAAGAEAADVHGEGNHQVTVPDMAQAWQAIDVIAQSATEADIPLERAMKFLTLVSMNFRAKGIRPPKGRYQ